MDLKKWNKKREKKENKAKTNLLPRNRILHQHQMRQLGQIPQRIQIRQFPQIIRRQDQRRQIGDRSRQFRVDMIDSIPGKEEGVETWEKGEVSERGDVIVGEIDCILVLFN